MCLLQAQHSAPQRHVGINNYGAFEAAGLKEKEKRRLYENVKSFSFGPRKDWTVH